MDVSVRNQLMQDYVKKFVNFFRMLEITGFCRFVIRKGKIVERSRATKLYNIFILIYANASASYLLWFSNPNEKYLSIVEYIAILHFTVFANLLISDITFGDEYAGLELMQNNIEIDTLLGAEETAFMREVSIVLYRIIVIAIGFTQVSVVAYMYYVFHVSIAIHVVGSIYFLWIFFSYDEFCFFIYLYSFLTTRVRFLNVALMKITNIKMEYIPNQWLFHKMFWKDEYDERVTFHTRSDTKDYCVVLKMLFDQLRRIENCYSFTVSFLLLSLFNIKSKKVFASLIKYIVTYVTCILLFQLVLGVVTVAIGSLVAVQTFIMYIQTSEVSKISSQGFEKFSMGTGIEAYPPPTPSDNLIIFQNRGAR